MSLQKSNISVFNNNIKKHNRLSDIDLLFSSEYEFLSHLEKGKSTNTPKIIISFSEVEFFNSRVTNKITKTELDFSKGYLEIENSIHKLADSSTTYDDIKDDIVNETIEYNWFDNSVLSRLIPEQLRVIPWGYNIDNFQLSYNFPEYIISFEFEANRLDKYIPLNTELNFFPPIEEKPFIDIEFDTRYYTFELPFEFARGYSFSVLTNIELEKLEGQVYPLTFDFNKKTLKDYTTNLEYKRVYNENNITNIECDMFTSLYPYLNFEYRRVYNNDGTLDFELYRTTFHNELLSFENLTSAENKRILSVEYIKEFIIDEIFNFEFINYYPLIEYLDLELDIYPMVDSFINFETAITSGYKHLDLEYRRVYNEDYILDIEYDIPYLSRSYDIGFEIDSKINYDYITNFEYRRVYNNDSTLDYDVNVHYINKNYDVSFETLLSTSYSTLVADLEFMRDKEVKINQQVFAVPLAYKDNKFQIYHKGVWNYELPLECNVSNVLAIMRNQFEVDLNILEDVKIDIEYDIYQLNKSLYVDIESNIAPINTLSELELEYKNVYNIDEIINLESFNSVLEDTNTDIEYNIDHLNKDYELTLEYVQSITDYYNLDIEIDNFINTENDVQIEYVIDKINKDYNIDLEFFTSINSKQEFNLELFIATVSKTLNLEFDVLDLVYYFIRKGYNIVPWGYSDGKGNFNENVQNYWDKQSEELTTIENGLYNQLDFLSKEIPEFISYSDSKQNTFGTIIKDKQIPNIELKDKFLYYHSLDDSYTLVLGKKQKEARTVGLKQGVNLTFFDGQYNKSNQPMFNDKIKPQIEDKIIDVQFWNQKLGTWKTLVSDFDHPLYYEMDINGSPKPIPYIIKIIVSEECSFVSE